MWPHWVLKGQCSQEPKRRVNEWRGQVGRALEKSPSLARGRPFLDICGLLWWLCRSQLYHATPLYFSKAETAWIFVYTYMLTTKSKLKTEQNHSASWAIETHVWKTDVASWLFVGIPCFIPTGQHPGLWALFQGVIFFATKLLPPALPFHQDFISDYLFIDLTNKKMKTIQKTWTET